MRLLPKSAAYTFCFKMVLAVDGHTPATGLTVAITISKNGAAFGNLNAGATNATEISAGIYKVALDSTDTGTEGDLIVRGTAATADDLLEICQVAAPVKLADVVTHGGTTAKFRLGTTSGDPALYVTNSGGAAVHFEATGGSGAGLMCWGNGSGNGIVATGGASGGGVAMSAGGTSSGLSIQGGDSGPAIRLLGPYTTPGPVVLIDATAANCDIDGGPGIKINVGDGHGVEIVTAGTSKHGILVTGGTGGTSDGIKAVAGTGGVAFRQDILTQAMTESYNTDGAAATAAQALYGILQRMTEFVISSTSITVKKLDGSTTAYTLTMDSATAPTSSTRSS